MSSHSFEHKAQVGTTKTLQSRARLSAFSGEGEQRAYLHVSDLFQQRKHEDAILGGYKYSIRKVL